MLSEETSAARILDNIFTIMQELYDEMRSTGNRTGDHGKVFNIFAELGRTLAGADRASFWRWDKGSRKLITNAATGVEQIVIDDTSGLVGRALADSQRDKLTELKNRFGFYRKGAANILRKSKQNFYKEELCMGLLASPLRIRVS